MPNKMLKVLLDLNNPTFQENLLNLQNPERHAALNTLDKIRKLSQNDLYMDKDLKGPLRKSKPHASRENESNQVHQLKFCRQ